MRRPRRDAGRRPDRRASLRAAVRGARPRRLGDDRRLHPDRHLPASRRPADAATPSRGRRCHVWWGDDRFVPRDHPLSNVKPFDDILLDLGDRQDGQRAGRPRPGVPIPARAHPPVPDERGDRRGPGRAGCAPSWRDELRAAGLRRRRRLAGVRPRDARRRRRRARPVGVPGLAGVRRRRTGRWRSRRRRTSSHTSSGSPSTPPSSRVARQILVVDARGGQGRAILADIFGPERRPAPLAGAARAPRGGDLDPRRGGGGPPASALMAVRRRRQLAIRDAIEIRRAEAGDAGGIGDVWLSSWRVDVRLPAVASGRRRPPLARDRARARVTRRGSRSSQAERSSALMALSDDMIEQLYVAPAWIGRGLG